MGGVTRARYVPAKQLKQTEARGTEEKRPDGQMVHVDRPVAAEK